MTLGKSLALVLVGVLAACEPSAAIEDDVRDDGPVVPDDDVTDDTGEAITDGYINAPSYDWTVPGPNTPEVEGGLSGKVYYLNDGQMIPIQGARAVLMTLAGTLSYETDNTGVFEFDVDPGDYILLVEAKGYWGIQRKITVPEQGLFGLRWEMAITDAHIEELAKQVGLPFDTANGIFSTWFTGAIGGETVHLSVSSDLPVTYDENNQPVLTNRLLESGMPMLIIGDVETGRVGLDPVGPTTQSRCRADDSPIGNWLSLPHVVTYVTIECVNPS